MSSGHTDVWRYLAIKSKGNEIFIISMAWNPMGGFVTPNWDNTRGGDHPFLRNSNRLLFCVTRNRTELRWVWSPKHHALWAAETKTMSSANCLSNHRTLLTNTKRMFLKSTVKISPFIHWFLDIIILMLNTAKILF